MEAPTTPITLSKLIVISANKMGMSIKELPVNWTHKSNGKINFLKDSIRYRLSNELLGEELAVPELYLDRNDSNLSKFIQKEKLIWRVGGLD